MCLSHVGCYVFSDLNCWMFLISVVDVVWGNEAVFGLAVMGCFGSMGTGMPVQIPCPADISSEAVYGCSMPTMPDRVMALNLLIMLH